MKYSTKLSDAVHIMAFIAINQDFDLSSTAIAASIQTNPAFVRQIMMKLKQAGLMSSVAGHAKPSLIKPAEQITLLDIYKAVEGDKPLLHLDTHTNPKCGVGVNIQLALQDYYQEIQKTAEERMSQISLHDIIESYERKAGLSNGT
ncbi:MAG: Rrf2 family transcriptional regulator [Lachnospiraceae bacterium]|nr:Rrf2 family transcriptional regulator [Lachnospiraceae bacterium]